MAKELQKPETPASGDVELRENAREGLISASDASSDLEHVLQRDLNVTEDDLLEAKEVVATLSLQDVHKVRCPFTLVNSRSQSQMMKQVYRLYGRDPNFPMAVIEKIDAFIHNDDILANPEKHQLTIHEVKIQAALITNNSPYSEVRAVVPNRDDPSLPCSTIRAWAMGLVFAAAIAFVNGFFEMRQPPIGVSAAVPQLLAYPLGKFLERVLPDVGFVAFGVRHSLNPGPFNRKEHMLITIMASISVGAPYTNYIAWIQYLHFFFNQSWANSIGYQILLGLSANFIGYGLAGLCRRFLVYPSYCVWPSSLATVALNTAFHGEGNTPVLGPFKRIWHMSRLRFFCLAAVAMFCYFWLPNYVFAGLSWFSWMTWIAPDSRDLAIVTGGYTGLGLNPLPTFDWNIATTMVHPLVFPIHTTMNVLAGAVLSFIILVSVYYGNAYSMAYLPVNSNRVFDHFGGPYNVSYILDHRGLFDAEKYEAYSPAFLSAGNYIQYLFFFAVYAAAITYGVLYHHRHIVMGFRDLINSFRPSKKQEVEADQVLDVHNRLMKSYREVPEWWYMICLAFAFIVGIVGISQWPTHTSPAVVPFGVILTLIFIVPLGIISATTGVEVSLNVLAEFLGGSFVEGNAVSLSLFKAYGYTTCSHAIHFSVDMKLAHYVKIPPRFTFWAQMVPMLVSTFVYVGILQYQMRLEDICTPAAPYRFTCPTLNTFFTSAVLWGTIGPRKLFGAGGQYVETLVGFPVGVLVVVVFWWLGKKYPKNKVIRSTHPVVLLKGGHIWAPYNFSYLLPAVPIAWLSWMYIKKRYLGLWAKYNYILAVAFSIGIALSALVTFFALQYNDINIDWWGNRAPFQGCDGNASCVLKPLSPGEYFGPRIGQFH